MNTPALRISSRTHAQDDDQETAGHPEQHEALLDDDEFDFEEFGAYGKMASGARVKGSEKSIDIPKMRANRDGGGRKFNKPLHTDKRGL